MKPFFLSIFLIFLFSLLANYISTFEPFFTGKIIDALTKQNKTLFFQFINFFIILQIIGFIFSMLISWFQFLLNRKIGTYCLSCLYLNFLYLPTKTYTDKNKGFLLNLFKQDLSVLISVYTLQVPSILNSIVIIFVITFRLLKIDCLLFVLTIIVSVVPIILAKIFGKKQAKITKIQYQQEDAYMEFLNESISGLQEIKNYSARKFFMKKFKHLIQNIYNIYKKITLVSMKSSTAAFASNFIINISFFIIVGLSVFNGKNTVGIITASLMYSQKFRTLVSSILSVYKQIIISKVSIKRLEDSFNARKYKMSIVFYKDKDNANKEIIIEDLSFTYSNGSKIFETLNINFSYPGLYLIKGDNGSGKTTLFNILAKDLTKTDGMHLTGSICFINLNKKIGFVTQKPFIFSATILENISFLQNINEQKLYQVLIQTKLDKVIKSLPHGLNTKLGKNILLSQGQMQRLALARCLIQNAEVILFDEIENAMDSETASSLFDILKDLKTKKLILMITHNEIYDEIATDIIKLSKIN